MLTPAEVVDLVFPELFPEAGEFYFRCGWYSDYADTTGSCHPPAFAVHY